MNENAQQIAKTVDTILGILRNDVIWAQHFVKKKNEHFAAWDWTHETIPHNGSFETASYRQLLGEGDEEAAAPVIERLNEYFPKLPCRFKIDVLFRFRDGKRWMLTLEFTEGVNRDVYRKVVIFDTKHSVNFHGVDRDWHIAEDYKVKD